MPQVTRDPEFVVMSSPASSPPIGANSAWYDADAVTFGGTNAFGGTTVAPASSISEERASPVVAGVATRARGPREGDLDVLRREPDPA
jgi:hypothetical protein